MIQLSPQESTLLLWYAIRETREKSRMLLKAQRSQPYRTVRVDGHKKNNVRRSLLFTPTDSSSWRYWVKRTGVARVFVVKKQPGRVRAEEVNCKKPRVDLEQ